MALLACAVLSAIASGVPFPILGILFGQLIDDISAASCNGASPNGTDASVYQSDVNSKVLVVVYIGIANLALIYIYIVSWNLFGERLAQRLREKYLRSLLHKDVSFFDRLSPGEVSSHLNADITTIQQGISEKVGIVLNAISFFITAYAIAFIKDAKLGGMLVSLTPAFLLMSLVGGHYIGKYAGVMSTQISSASSIALEALSNVVVVHAFGANGKLESRFAELMSNAQTAGIRKAIATSIQSGLLYFIAYSANALAYWQGSRQIAATLDSNSSGTTLGVIYTVIFILVDATIILSAVAPFLQVFGTAQVTFNKLRKNIDTKLDVHQVARGTELDNTFLPNIELQNVSFAYPSRPDTKVLQHVSVRFPAHRQTAIVGQSGSGKSTIANLLMRLYDPLEGAISLSNNNLRNLDLATLRSCMSLVQQEPSLLDRSILENIALGLVNSRKYPQLQQAVETGCLREVVSNLHDGANLSEAVKGFGVETVEIVELVEQAARLADAHDFIIKLQHGYGTVVGSKGTLISGGQKQRISLARALIKDPDILILDEATASLDSISERRIQAALANASKGRTTITIAHRLSTIKDADNIIVMMTGKVVEEGRHADLINLDGAYAELVRLQNSKKESRVDADDSIMARGLNTEKLDGKDTIETTDADEEDDSNEGREHKDAEAEKKRDPDIDKKASAHFILRTLSPLFRSSYLILLVAFIAVIVVGSTYSAAAIIFGNTIGALSPCNSVSSIISAGEFFALMFFILAIVEFFANTVSWSGFGWVAEKVLQQVRVLSFRSLLEQDLHWHESANRNPISLLSLITSDGNAISGLTGSTVGTILSVLVNLVAAIVLSHILAWKLALVCLATVPVILGAGSMQLIVLARFATKHQEAFTNSVGIAVEAVESIKTVSAYCLQDEILQTYRRSLKSPIRETTRRSLYANMWLALAYGIPNFVYALAYWWGTRLVIAGETSQVNFFIVLVALLVSAQLWGQLFTIAPDVSKAFKSVRRVVNLVSLEPSGGSSDQKTEQASGDIEKHAIIKEIVKSGARTGAQITFTNISFSYPARPSVLVLKDLSLKISPGQFIALTGPSGAGKSTIIALLERMYRPKSGTITIDNTDIAFAPTTFRDSIAYVPQDSVLFDGTIKFNISLGASTNQTITDSDIEEACRVANIHDTIASLPDGYDTECGAGGTQLSGGQKQRLAIARALVRKPSLLLLDESTSALDAESERALRDGLEEARRRTGMTVIAIAHRLNTIRSADVIFLIEDGKVVDQGSHEELIRRSERYRINAEHQGL